MSQTPHHLYPLQTDPQNEEPYLRLPPPHDNIIITPPRPEDFSAIAEVLNEREVYTWLYSPKYPVSEDQAQDRLDGATKASQLSLRELERLYQTDGGQALDLSCSAVVGSCPVKSLREVKQDGTQVYIGDIGVRRSTFFHVRDNQSRDALAKENLEREVGDPEIVWTIGCKFRRYTMSNSFFDIISLRPRLSRNISPWTRNHVGCRPDPH